MSDDRWTAMQRKGIKFARTFGDQCTARRHEPKVDWRCQRVKGHKGQHIDASRGEVRWGRREKKPG